MLTIKENVLKYGPVECKLKSTRTPWDRAYSNMEDAAGPLWSYLSIEDFDNLCSVLHTEAPEELARFLNPQALINPDLDPDSGQPQISLVEYLRRVGITRRHLVKSGILESYGENVVGGLISNPPPKLMTILSTHTDPNLKDLYKALLQVKKDHEEPEPESVNVQKGVLTYTQNNTKVVVKLLSDVADFASTPSLAAPQLWKELCLEDMLCLIRGIDRAQASTTYRVFPELVAHFGTVTDKRLQVHTASFPFPSERSGTVGLFEVAEMIGAARAGDRATYLYHFCQVSPALSAMLLHPTDEVVDAVKSLPTLQQLLLDARSANPYSFKGKTLSYHDTPILTLSQREFPTLGIPTLGIKDKQACLAILRDTIVPSSDIEAIFRACLVCRAPDPAFMLLEVVESICTTYSMELSLALPKYNWAEDQTKFVFEVAKHSKFTAEVLAGATSEITKLVDALAEKSGSAAVKRLQALILQARYGYVEDPSIADVGKWSIVEGRVQCADEHFTACFYNLGIEFSGTMSTPKLADYLVNHSTPTPKDAFFDRTDYKLYSLRSHMQRLVDEERTVGELKRALIDDVATKRSAYEASKSLKDLESWKLALRAKEMVQGVWKVENGTFSMRTTRGLESESTGAGGTEGPEWRQTAPLNMLAPNVQEYLKAMAKQVETVGLPLKTKDGLWAPQYDDPLEKEENWALTETYAERVSDGLRIRSSFKEPYAVVSTEALAKILLLKYSPTDNLGVVDDLEGRVRTLRSWMRHLLDREVTTADELILINEVQRLRKEYLSTQDDKVGQAWYKAFACKEVFQADLYIRRGDLVVQTTTRTIEIPVDLANVGELGESLGATYGLSNKFRIFADLGIHPSVLPIFMAELRESYEAWLVSAGRPYFAVIEDDWLTIFKGDAQEDIDLPEGKNVPLSSPACTATQLVEWCRANSNVDLSVLSKYLPIAADLYKDIRVEKAVRESAMLEELHESIYKAGPYTPKVKWSEDMARDLRSLHGIEAPESSTLESKYGEDVAKTVETSASRQKLLGIISKVKQLKDSEYGEAGFETEEIRQATAEFAASGSSLVCEVTTPLQARALTALDEGLKRKDSTDQIITSLVSALTGTTSSKEVIRKLNEDLKTPEPGRQSTLFSMSYEKDAVNALSASISKEIDEQILSELLKAEDTVELSTELSEEYKAAIRIAGYQLVKQTKRMLPSILERQGMTRREANILLEAEIGSALVAGVLGMLLNLVGNSKTDVLSKELRVQAIESVGEAFISSVFKMFQSPVEEALSSIRVHTEEEEEEYEEEVERTLRST